MFHSACHSWNMKRLGVHPINLLACCLDLEHSGSHPFSWRSRNALHAQVDSTCEAVSMVAQSCTLQH